LKEDVAIENSQTFLFIRSDC